MCNSSERRHRRPRPSRTNETSHSPPAEGPPPPDTAREMSECRLTWPAAECDAPCTGDHTVDHQKVSARPYSKPPSDTIPYENADSRAIPPRTTAHHGWWPGVVMYAILFLALLSPTMALSPSSGLNSDKESGVCSSMDIRNDPANLKLLTGCRVIEGFLHIVLIDNANESSYENLTFPELREITGYLLLFRAFGLQSLGKLFPNLAVIRGQDLFSNYALVVYDCRSMKEIGLFSLTDITRGGVRIQANTNMCYVQTINWDLIAQDAPFGHYIKGNKPENECPVCYSSDEGVNETGAKCPEAPGQPSHITNRKLLCWNKDHCQKVCKRECGNNTCSADGSICCEERCLGGCTGNSSNCTVCRHLSMGDYNDRECIMECPVNTYKHYKRRCITEEECRRIEKPKGIDLQNSMSRYPFKPFNGTCLLECPHGYVESNSSNKLTCVSCNGPCRKECQSAKLDSIEHIQKMKGCTIIKGSLSIENIKGGGSVTKELEEGLGLVEEITGNLKIVRCFPLISLSFFKKLRIIGGESTDTSSNLPGTNSSFVVTGNQNLQELWDWDTYGNITISKGSLLIHENPKLCLGKIEPLRRMAKESTFSQLEVGKLTNGDKVACEVSKLNVTVALRRHDHVLFVWPAFQLGDDRTLLGYLLYFLETPHKNVTLFDGRDACRSDGWQVTDIAPASPNVYGLLLHLKPYTQYAVYIKTETISSERHGAQSDILYVRTLPSKPSQPIIEKLVSMSSDSLMLSWKAPLRPNGNITMYRIVVQYEKNTEDSIQMRNYCSEPMQEKKVEPVEPLTPPRPPETPPVNDKCPCHPNPITSNEEDTIGFISFENQLQNMVYRKRPNVEETRRRRDIESAKSRWTRDAESAMSDDEEDDDDKLLLPFEAPQPPSLRDIQTERSPSGLYNTFSVDVGPEQRSINISQLRHYALHRVSIWACREVEKYETTIKEPDNQTYIINNCSLDQVQTERTLKLDGADNIKKVDVRVLQANHSLGIARLDWKEPENPNGIIVTYYIVYKRHDIENAGASFTCITRSQYVNNSYGYIIRNLTPGNYSVKVRATSIAGDGNFSKEEYFYIKSDNSYSVTVVLAVVGGVLLALIFISIAYYVHRKYFAPPNIAATKIIASVNPEYVSSGYVPDEWEVPRDKVEIIKELGQGAFGMVYEGIAKDLSEETPEIRCAVKTINEHATDRERTDFLNEASVMKAFDTAHVVRLLGVVSCGQPTFVVMELMANGDLKSYLRSHSPYAENPRISAPPSLQRLLQMAMEIADGMAYLSAKKFVHRDLAARNCMVAEDLTVKVGDFGMTRDIYETDYYRKGTKGLLPVRWMSPESLKDGVFTSASDVWSYGVVLWEMATLASQPYQGLSNDQVLRYVIDGGVMGRPENCPDRLYQLMKLTWHHRPSERPTFLQLVSLLSSDASPKFKEISFFDSQLGQDLLHQSHTQPTAGTSEEPTGSYSRIGAQWHQGLESVDSDINPPRSPHPSPVSSSYRDVMRLVSYGDRARADPHETEALVHLSPSTPGPKVTPPQSTSQNNAPNGYLPRTGNNGNPTSFNTSQC